MSTRRRTATSFALRRCTHVGHFTRTLLTNWNINYRRTLTSVFNPYRPLTLSYVLLLESIWSATLRSMTSLSAVGPWISAKVHGYSNFSVMYDSKLTQSCPANRHNGWRRGGKLLIWPSNRHHCTVWRSWLCYINIQ